MIEPIINGLLLGSVLSVFVGATFFMLIETSINKGFKPALAMNLGVFTSDLMLIAMVIFFTADILEKIVQSHIFRYIGAIAFIGIGIFYLIKNKIEEKRGVSNKSYNQLFVRGILANVLNPSVTVFWIGAMVFALANYQYSNIQLFYYFASAMTVVISADMLKIYFASKLKKILTRKILVQLQILTGIIFIIVGIKIFI